MPRPLLVPLASLLLLALLTAQGQFRCEPIVPDCVEAGGVVPVIPNAPECCRGLVTAPQYDVVDGECLALPGAMVCIASNDGLCGAGEDACNSPADCPSDPDCTPEGEAYGIYPGAPPCCEGLVSVGCAAPSADGTCMPCAGASYCTRCGDGDCGPGENACRCPADCD